MKKSSNLPAGVRLLRAGLALSALASAAAWALFNPVFVARVVSADHHLVESSVIILLGVRIIAAIYGCAALLGLIWIATSPAAVERFVDRLSSSPRAAAWCLAINYAVLFGSLAAISTLLVLR